MKRRCYKFKTPATNLFLGIDIQNRLQRIGCLDLNMLVFVIADKLEG